MSGIVLVEIAAASVPTPASGKVTVFADASNGGVPSFKDDAGVVTPVTSADAELVALAGLTSAANKIPMFSGSGTATLLTLDTDTALTANSDTTLASQKAVKAYVDAVVGGAPGALDTLNELAAALADDASFATTVTTALTGKAALAGDTFVGAVEVPDDPYDATAWNGSTEVPTKNAVRDVIEGLGGSIPTNLDDLADVDTSGVGDGDVLTFDSGSGDWVAAAPAGGGGGVVGASWDNAGSVLTLTGTTAIMSEALKAGTITRLSVTGAGGSGSATIGVRACSEADYLTDPANLADITGGGHVVLSGVNGVVDTSFSGWTNLTVTKADRFAFVLLAVTTFTQLTILVEYA